MAVFVQLDGVFAPELLAAVDRAPLKQAARNLRHASATRTRAHTCTHTHTHAHAHVHINTTHAHSHARVHTHNRCNPGQTAGQISASGRRRSGVHARRQARAALPSQPNRHGEPARSRHLAGVLVKRAHVLKDFAQARQQRGDGALDLEVLFVLVFRAQLDDWQHFVATRACLGACVWWCGTSGAAVVSGARGGVARRRSTQQAVPAPATAVRACTSGGEAARRAVPRRRSTRRLQQRTRRETPCRKTRVPHLIICCALYFFSAVSFGILIMFARVMMHMRSTFSFREARISAAMSPITRRPPSLSMLPAMFSSKVSTQNTIIACSHPGGTAQASVSTPAGGTSARDGVGRQRARTPAAFMMCAPCTGAECAGPRQAEAACGAG